MTRKEFFEACTVTCPHCQRGVETRQRVDTGEWVHDIKNGSAFSHTLCWANGLRNSHFALGFDDSVKPTTKKPWLRCQYERFFGGY